MIFTDLFEEAPIASLGINPDTGNAWLPSELAAAQKRLADKKIQKAQQAAKDQAARDAVNNPAPMPQATSSTATAPTSVQYTGTLAPKKKVAPNFTQTSSGYKLPGTPSVPTVPNMTQAPAKVETPPETAPSAINNMSRQLAARGQSQSSTGGATIATGTGVRHAANPLNPNQPAGQSYNFSGQQAAEKIAVKDITTRVNSQLKLVKDLDDLKKIKQLIDRQFTKHGLVSESAFAKRDILIDRAIKILESRTT